MNESQVQFSSPYLTQHETITVKIGENKEKIDPRVEISCISRSHFSHWRMPVSIRKNDERTLDSYGDMINRGEKSPEDKAEIYSIKFKIYDSEVTIEQLMDRLEHRSGLAVHEIEKEKDHVRIWIITWEESWREAIDLIKDMAIRPEKKAEFE